MKYRERILKLSVAFVIVMLVSNQISMRGQVALGSVEPSDYASQPADSYLSGGPVSNGSFLGITSITNRNAISGAAIGLLGFGVYSVITDAHGSGSLYPPAQTAKTIRKSIYDVLNDLPDDFSEIVKLIETGELVSLLRAEGAYTFFAPSDRGLQAQSVATQEHVRDPARKAALILLMKKHIVVGRFTINELLALSDGSTLEALTGEKLLLRNTKDEFSIDGAPIVQTDLIASNGWVHPIEKLMEK